ncbi:MAG: inorganic phosphate transporter [Planctomycetes bacterium]|nr:inorganic phosphate transporter [Planctomycetota bacterium]
MTVAIVAALCLLAAVNGANDNFKGVATLFGSARSSYRMALAWATATTLAGALAATTFGAGLAAKFSGRGLVPDALAATPEFALAIAGSAALTVLLATRFGFPVSTTHALMGALLGAGLAHAPESVGFAALGKGFVLPLLLSPVVALSLTWGSYAIARRVRAGGGIEAQSCICVEPDAPPLLTAPAQGAVARTVALPTAALPAVVVSTAGCATSGSRGVTARQALDVAHFLSAGAVGFARGLNDAPKIAALATTVPFLPQPSAVVGVAVAMALGGVLGARRVAETMSHRITPMNEGQGFAANLVTAAIVTTASHVSLPVSTTHVSVGALFGIGASSGSAHGKAVAQILLAWLVTGPTALAIAWLLARAIG